MRSSFSMRCPTRDVSCREGREVIGHAEGRRLTVLSLPAAQHAALSRPRNFVSVCDSKHVQALRRLRAVHTLLAPSAGNTSDEKVLNVPGWGLVPSSLPFRKTVHQ